VRVTVIDVRHKAVVVRVKVAVTKSEMLGLRFKLVPVAVSRFKVVECLPKECQDKTRFYFEI
jgi:hypothetical protein